MREVSRSGTMTNRPRPRTSAVSGHLRQLESWVSASPDSCRSEQKSVLVVRLQGRSVWRTGVRTTTPRCRPRLPLLPRLHFLLPPGDPDRCLSDPAAAWISIWRSRRTYSRRISSSSSLSSVRLPLPPPPSPARQRCRPPPNQLSTHLGTQRSRGRRGQQNEGKEDRSRSRHAPGKHSRRKDKPQRSSGWAIPHPRHPASPVPAPHRPRLHTTTAESRTFR